MYRNEGEICNHDVFQENLENLRCVFQDDKRGKIYTNLPDSLTAGDFVNWCFVYMAGEYGMKSGTTLCVFPPYRSMTRWEMGEVKVSSSNPEVKIDFHLRNSYPKSFHFNRCPHLEIKVKEGLLKSGDYLVMEFGGIGTLWEGYNMLARVQEYAMKGASFEILMKHDGDEPFRLLTKIPLDVLPGAPAKIKAVLKEAAGPGLPHRLIVGYLDEYGNFTAGGFDEIELQDEKNARLHFNNEIDKKGCRTIPVKLKNDPLRITVLDRGKCLMNRSNFVSNENSRPFKIYFGDLHVMSGAVLPLFMINDTEYAYNFARYQMGLDFAAITNGKDSSPHSWTEDIRLAEEFNDDHDFVTLPAYECYMKKGHKNVYFNENNPPRLAAETPEELWSFLENRDALVIPHHPNIESENSNDSWSAHDFKSHNPVLERLIEITQIRGSFEMDGPGPGVNFYMYGSSVQDALKRGMKLGFVGGTDNHRGEPGSSRSPLHGLDYRVLNGGGLTAVLAEELTRKAVWNALKSRRCYATNGERMLVRFMIDDLQMGNIVTEGNSDEYNASRNIHISVFGTDRLKSISLIRNNEDIKTFPASGFSEKIEYRDKEELSGLLSTAKGYGFKNVFYYIRVEQVNGRLAWSSPIWFE